MKENQLTNFFIKMIAFVKKDLQVYYSYKINLISNLVLVVFIFTLFFFISSAESGKEFVSSKNLLGDVLIALILIDFMLVFVGVFSNEVRAAQLQGTFEALILSHTSILTIILSAYGFTFIKSFLRLIIYILIGLLIFEIKLDVFRLPLFFMLTLYGSIPFIAMGVISASFVMIFKVGNLANLFIGLISISLSGIFFPIEYFPETLEFISNFNPLKHSVDASRKILLESQEIMQIKKELISIAFLITVLLPTSILIVYYSLRFSKKNGNLNHF